MPLDPDTFYENERSDRLIEWRSQLTAKDAIDSAYWLNKDLQAELKRECSGEHPSLGSVTKVLLQNLDNADMVNADADIRRSAAQLLGEAAPAFLGSAGEWQTTALEFPMLQQVVDSLISSFGDQKDPQIPEVAIKALLCFAYEIYRFANSETRSCPENIKTLRARIVRGVLNRIEADRSILENDEDLAAETMALILNCGLDAASESVPLIMRLLEQSSANLQVTACSFLAHVGSEAESAVPALVNLAAAQGPREVRLAALSALAFLDPAGDALSAAIRTDHERQEIQGLLVDVGEEGRELRRALQNAWNPKRPLEPPYDSSLNSNDIDDPTEPMTCVELAKKIWPSETITETTKHRVREWMRMGALPANRVRRGRYVVSKAGLAELIKINK
jgi:hypothetical protein